MLEADRMSQCKYRLCVWFVHFVVVFNAFGTKFCCPCALMQACVALRFDIFFIPNIVCIKGEEYDELKGALGNKKD